MVETIIFATEDPISVTELVRCMPYGCDPAKVLLQLSKRYVGQSVNLKKVSRGLFVKPVILGF